MLCITNMYFLRQMVIDQSPVRLPKRKRSQGGYKVTRDEFTPRTKKFADVGKKEMRRAVTTENAFPHEKDTFSLGVLQNVATKGPTHSEEFEDTFARAVHDPETLKRIITYVCLSTFSLYILIYFSKVGYGKSGCSLRL